MLSLSSSEAISGAKISEYLLEKSRIVNHSAGERNYHVFYELLSGLPQQDLAKYGLTTPEHFFYLSQVSAHGPQKSFLVLSMTSSPCNGLTVVVVASNSGAVTMHIMAVVSSLLRQYSSCHHVRTTVMSLLLSCCLSLL